MTLEELNELLNLFDLNMIVKDNNVYLFNIKTDSKLDTYSIMLNGSELEQINTSNRAKLFKGYISKATEGNISYYLTIRYDENIDKYYFSKMSIENSKTDISKIIIKDSNLDRIEYYVDNNRSYSYTLVLTKNNKSNWKEIYFDELDLNVSSSSNVYRVNGVDDNYEVLDDELDYIRICNQDPLIVEMIKYFLGDNTLLPELEGNASKKLV